MSATCLWLVTDYICSQWAYLKERSREILDFMLGSIKLISAFCETAYGKKRFISELQSYLGLEL
jgi:hypothetical protein